MTLKWTEDWWEKGRKKKKQLNYIISAAETYQIPRANVCDHHSKIDPPKLSHRTSKKYADFPPSGDGIFFYYISDNFYVAGITE